MTYKKMTFKKMTYKKMTFKKMTAKPVLLYIPQESKENPCLHETWKAPEDWKATRSMMAVI
jgi:hypothetical protein